MPRLSRVAQLYNHRGQGRRNGQMQPWQRISALVLLGGMMLLSCVSADGNLHFSREDRSRAALLSLQLQARTGLAAVAELSRREETRAEAQNPSIIGYSAGGLPIESYAFGAGPNRVVLVGGIHGGAEWNTIVLAYTAIDYFSRHA
ncbi:MAG: hypothetical protein KDE19_09080, partial [Caldilineaceae bacterium]|nr:hypothetical protein [Caldilineaceae bacterium]